MTSDQLQRLATTAAVQIVHNSEISVILDGTETKRGAVEVVASIIACTFAVAMPMEDARPMPLVQPIGIVRTGGSLTKSTLPPVCCWEGCGSTTVIHTPEGAYCQPHWDMHMERLR